MKLLFYGAVVWPSAVLLGKLLYRPKYFISNLRRFIVLNERKQKFKKSQLRSKIIKEFCTSCSQMTALVFLTLGNSQHVSLSRHQLPTIPQLLTHKWAASWGRPARHSGNKLARKGFPFFSADIMQSVNLRKPRKSSNWCNDFYPLMFIPFG